MAILKKDMENERAPLQSKKFIAYMATEFLWKALLFLMVWKYGDSLTVQGLLLTGILVAGFISVTYIGGQAALDHYTRVARIVSGKNFDNDDEGTR